MGLIFKALADRLTREEYRTFGGAVTGWNEYEYDTDGKRTKRWTGSGQEQYDYDLGQQLRSRGSVQYGYNAFGSLTQVNGPAANRALAYTADQWLAGVSLTSGMEEYHYDASGRRIGAVGNRGERRFVLASNGEVESPHLIADGTGAVLAAYTFAGRMPLARMDGSGRITYYLDDAMGNMIGSADNAGQMVATFEYDAFGNIRSQFGEVSSPGGGDFRFHGHWLEEATGYYHMRARDYDPVSGRFLTRDPEPLDEYQPETAQPYTFANHNPHYYSDPTGRFTLVELNVASFVRLSKAAGVTVSRRAAQRALNKLASRIVKEYLLNSLELLMPWDLTPFAGLTNSQFGTEFENIIREYVCDLFKNPRYFWFEPGIEPPSGKAVSTGYSCGSRFSSARKRGIRYPDLVVSLNPPFVPGSAASPPRNPKGITVLEAKISGPAFFRAYVRRGRQRPQFDAIINYAKNYSYSRTAVFLACFNGERTGKPKRFARSNPWYKFMQRECLRKQVIPVYIYGF